MRGLVRFLGAIMAVCFTAMVVLFTVSILQRTYFDPGKPARGAHIAVVDISGMIVSGTGFVKDLEEIENNKQVKAVVIRINSPGGLVGPSQEMFDAIKRVDKKIPVIASMGSLAASGGYYAALGARKIYANPGTLTASIGVIMEFMNTERLYDWAKVERFTMKAGKLKDVGSPNRKMTPEEKEFIQALLNDVHGQFRSALKDNRHLTDAEVDHYADGRVMTGSQAKAAKLIDALGGFTEALKDAKKLAGLPDTAPVSYPEPKRGLLKEILLGEPSEEESSVSKFFEAAALNLSAFHHREHWRVLFLSPLR